MGSISQPFEARSTVCTLDRVLGKALSRETTMATPLHELFSLRGKEIWVFGGAGYLGQASVSLLAALGAKVLCVDLDGRAQQFITSAKLEGVSAASLDVRDG